MKNSYGKGKKQACIEFLVICQIPNYELYIHYIILVEIIMALFIGKVRSSKVKYSFQITQLISCTIRIQAFSNSRALILYSRLPQRERWIILKGKMQGGPTKQVPFHPELFNQSLADGARLCLFLGVLDIYNMSMNPCL